jgi:DNA-binding transcriptional ArsR family regulator
MNKSERFDPSMQDLARFAKVLSHPARLAILRYLSNKKVSISGDISASLPLSRTTISQHLVELKELGLIESQIDGLKIIYRLNQKKIGRYCELLEEFFENINQYQNLPK